MHTYMYTYMNAHIHVCRFSRRGDITVPQCMYCLLKTLMTIDVLMNL